MIFPSWITVVDIDNKMVGGVRILDLTTQPETCVFAGSSDDEISYAEAFWHSVRLQPTMESRLVSSDIKQRLGIKKKPSSVNSSQPSAITAGNKLKDFFVRARTLEQISEFQRLKMLANARLQDRNILHKRRNERIQKEEISRGRLPSSTPRHILVQEKEEERKRDIGKAYSIEEMIRDIDEFEKMKELQQPRTLTLKDQGDL